MFFRQEKGGKMSKKYFFFDIDGTLTDRTTGQIVPSAAEAIRKLKQAGHFVSIATGRAFYKAENFRRDHGFDHMVCNGGHGIVYEGELRENRPLDYEKAKAVYDQAIALGYGSPSDVVVFGDDYNDLVMFDEQFYCVAMGNGCDDLKAKADYVAEKNTEDGIYKACEAHGWF